MVNRDDADAAGQQRKEALLSKEEIDTSVLVGEFDFTVLDHFSHTMRTELPSWDADQRSSPQPKKKKKKTGQPKSVDGSVNGEFAVLTDEEVQSKEAQEKNKQQKVADSTWINKWRGFTSALNQPASLDMSTRVLKLALCSRLVSFFRSVRKVSAAKEGTLPRDIFYPASTYSGMYWALQRMYKAEYQEQYYLVEERDRPPIIDWGSDADLMAIVNPVITVEMKMANTRLGSAIHDHEIQTLPVNTFKQLQSSGVFTLKTGEGIDNLLCYQMQVYHGIRGGAHLHRLKASSDFHFGRDGIMDERFVKLSDTFVNKTWQPTVKDPKQKRECPPAYEVKEDPMVCGVFLVENLHMVRPTIIKSNPEKQVPENLFLKPIPIRQLPKGWEKAPFGSIKLFHPIPMGNKSIAKIVPSWFSELYQRSMLGVKSDGQSKHFTNSSCRHLLAQVLRENDVDEKVRLGSGGWRSEAGMANYGCSSRMALHDAFQMKSGATVVGDAARAQEHRERKDAEASEFSLSAKAVVEAAAADVGGAGVDYEGGVGCHSEPATTAATPLPPTPATVSSSVTTAATPQIPTMAVSTSSQGKVAENEATIKVLLAKIRELTEGLPNSSPVRLDATLTLQPTTPVPQQPASPCVTASSEYDDEFGVNPLALFNDKELQALEGVKDQLPPSLAVPEGYIRLACGRVVGPDAIVPPGCTRLPSGHIQQPNGYVLLD